MTAKCSKCGIRVVTEGQWYGTQLPNGDWLCDDNCELGLSLKPDVLEDEVIESREPVAIVDDLEKWRIILTPSTQSQLVINENFMIHSTVPMPNWWHRFWYRLLLGWRWEAIGKERKPVRIPQWLRALLFFTVGFLLTQLLLAL